MTQIAWYLEGWEVDDDDFEDEDPLRCINYKDMVSMPLNPQRRQHARERRLLLVSAGLATYELSAEDSVIVCLCCGMLSANLNDIREKYCGYCQDFHTERTKH